MPKLGHIKIVKANDLIVWNKYLSYNSLYGTILQLLFQEYHIKD
jgi:hypothetical protein